MKANDKKLIGGLALQVTLVVALLSTSAILLASSFLPQARPSDAVRPTAASATFTPSVTAPMTTFTVTSTADTDGSTCGPICTLRQAVNASNLNPPPPNATNLIAFNIPSNDPGCDPTTHVCTIALTDCLGRSGNFCFGLGQPVIIDGYTQPGAIPNTLSIGDNANIRIKIIGDPGGNRVIQFCSPTGCGLPGDSSGSTVRGLCLAGITNTHQTLVFLGSNNDVVTGNFLGVDTDGTTVISDGDPVDVRQATSGSIIGGTSPAARNVMASDGIFGVILNDGDATVVQGNYIGTNAAGTAAIGSLATGIDMELGTGVIIGGGASGAGNVINATGSGISIGGVQFNAAANTTVQGNLIGMDATGTVAFYALNTGVAVGQSINTTIGGNTPGAANVINTRADGISIGGSPVGMVIQGNKIGTDITGTMPVGNGNCGIAIGQTSNGTIGGLNAEEANIIAFNGFNGVSIAGFAGQNVTWAILGNLVHDNARLGITLATSGCGATVPTPNDHCDTDDGTGANDFQNYPVITSASFSNGNVTLSGTLDSVANTMFRIEYFSNVQCDPSGFGQGQHFLGATVVTTGADCTVNFGPLSFSLPTGDTVATATATRLDEGGNPVETSEFSQCIDIFGLPTPTPTPSPTSTPVPTTTPTPSVTATPTPTATATATPTPTPTSTPTATPSATPTSTPGGCVFSHGYWKNHPEQWPVSQLQLGNRTYNQQELLSILHQPVNGNGLVQLAYQEIAAKLNIANGADGSCVAQTLAAVDALIGNLVIPPIGNGYLRPTVYVNTLTAYNEGELCAPHCQESPSPTPSGYPSPRSRPTPHLRPRS